MNRSTSDLLNRLNTVEQQIKEHACSALISEIENHQTSNFKRRHQPLMNNNAKEEQLLSFYAMILNEGLDSNTVLKTSRKIALAEKTLTNKTPILVPLSIHVLISELNLALALNIKNTEPTQSKEEKLKALLSSDEVIKEKQVILSLLDELSQYVLELMNDSNSVKMLKKSKLVFKTLGLSYFYTFITDYLDLVEGLEDISSINQRVLSFEAQFMSTNSEAL